MSSTTEISELLPAGLTDEEANFVYNVEVLGLPAVKAATLAGMPKGRMNAPHIIQSRELVKRELRGALAITREDVVAGYQDAIGMAKIIADPVAMIAGGKETAKILGLDAPLRIDINLQASIEVQQAHIRTLPTAELMKRLGADEVIDGEFYEVGR